MTFQNILTDLKSRKYAPFYLLHGEESFFIDQVTDYIDENVLSEAERGFNQTVLYGKETDFTTIVNSAKRYPMMAEYQVIIIKEAQSLDWDREAAVSVLYGYLENPLNSTIIVFDYKHGKFDKRKKAYKLFQKKGVILESNKLYDNQVADWIADYCKKAGYRIQSQAAALMAEYLGSNLSKVVNEIEKIFLNTSKEKEISTDDIQKNIGISKDFNVFELNKALAYKNVFKANQIVDYFIANPKSNPPQLVFGALTAYFIKVLKYHYTEDKSWGALAKTIGVRQTFVDEYAAAGRNYGKWKVFQIINLLREYDMKSKGVDNPNNLMEPLLREFIYKVLH